MNICGTDNMFQRRFINMSFSISQTVRFPAKSRDQCFRNILISQNRVTRSIFLRTYIHKHIYVSKHSFKVL